MDWEELKGQKNEKRARLRAKGRHKCKDCGFILCNCNTTLPEFINGHNPVEELRKYKEVQKKRLYKKRYGFKFNKNKG